MLFYVHVLMNELLKSCKKNSFHKKIQPELFRHRFAEETGIEEQPIEWLSPLKQDEYAEYYVTAILETRRIWESGIKGITRAPAYIQQGAKEPTPHPMEKSLVTIFVVVRTAFVCLLAFLTFPLSTEAACDKDPECGDPSAWSGFTRVVLRQSFPSEAAEYVASFDHNAIDASIDVVTKGSSKPMDGTVAFVGGRVMLTKGLKLDPGYEIDALDAPVLSIKLLMIILGVISGTS